LRVSSSAFLVMGGKYFPRLLSRSMFRLTFGNGRSGSGDPQGTHGTFEHNYDHALRASDSEHKRKAADKLERFNVEQLFVQVEKLDSLQKSLQ
jgi:hypothetical protein